MFGYLPAPCRCQIGNQAGLCHGVFCGLCDALARQYGQPAPANLTGNSQPLFTPSSVGFFVIMNR